MSYELLYTAVSRSSGQKGAMRRQTFRLAFLFFVLPDPDKRLARGFWVTIRFSPLTAHELTSWGEGV